GVFAHIDLYIEVAGRAAFHSRLALAAEADTIAGIHARRYLDRQGLGFLHPALAVAAAAGVGNNGAATVTIGAGLLYREEALLHAHLADAAAGGAGGGLAAGLGAAAVAGFAVHQGGHLDLHGAAAHGVFQ